MPTDDQQILVAGTAPVPADWLVPGNGQIKPKVVNAVFDGTGAAGDFLPTLEIVSDAGVVVGRYPAPAVVAGASAEVSWFPGVKNVPVQVVQLRYDRMEFYTTVGQVIHSGAVTPITFDAGNLVSATTKPLTGSGFPMGNFAVSVFECDLTLVVQWPAGAYDRYIEIVDASFATSGGPISWRVRNSTTPDGDIQTVTASFDGDETVPRAVAFNAFQASGADKTIVRWMTAQTIPYLLPPGSNV